MYIFFSLFISDPFVKLNKLVAYFILLFIYNYNFKNLQLFVIL